MPPPFKKRKVKEVAPEEITFDYAAREEYLTGFHKRKQARIKHAQEENAKKEKEEKLKFRRELRQQRKEQLEERVDIVNAMLKGTNGEQSEGADEEEDVFTGFDEQEIEPIDREDEYIDEDKYTTVTIESVGISKDGFEKVGDDDSSEDEEAATTTKDNSKNDDTEKKKRVWTKERPKTNKPKTKKKKFRYESKAERKATRMKQGAKKRAQAEARKGK